MNRRLRRLLEEMTNDGAPIDAYQAKLALISAEEPHSITIIPALMNEPLGDFNCVMHSLGLIGRLEYPCRPLGRFYADLAFLRSLIDSGELTPCTASAAALITWSNGDSIRHVGVLGYGERATSKWGCGHLCEHGVFEVPANYGDQLAFYSPIHPDVALDRLTRFRC